MRHPLRAFIAIPCLLALSLVATTSSVQAQRKRQPQRHAQTVLFDQPNAWGTAFYVGKFGRDGGLYFTANHHVPARPEASEIWLPKGQRSSLRGVVARDQSEHGLDYLLFAAKRLPVAPLGLSLSLARGPVTAVGFPQTEGVTDPAQTRQTQLRGSTRAGGAVNYAGTLIKAADRALYDQYAAQLGTGGYEVRQTFRYAPYVGMSGGPILLPDGRAAAMQTDVHFKDNEVYGVPTAALLRDVAQHVYDSGGKLDKELQRAGRALLGQSGVDRSTLASWGL